MIFKSKRPMKLYSSNKHDELILSKSFDKGTSFRYVNMSSSYLGYYELHTYIIQVIDNNNEEYNIEAYRVQNTKSIFVKGIKNANHREKTTWNEAFEGDCPIVI